MKLRLKLEFEPRDFWIGAFWKREPVREAVPINGHLGLVYLNHGDPVVKTDVWICLVPFLPLHFSWTEDHRP